MDYQQGKAAPKTGVWLAPAEAVVLAELWHDFERKFYGVAQGVLAGLSTNEIAANLKWGAESVRAVLRRYRKSIRCEVRLSREDTRRRIYRVGI